jgi:uncharacterized protein DUF1670
MSSQAYVGTQQRSFQAAFIHEMEQNYGFLKSKRLLTLLADDIQRLVEEFYPLPEHLRPGWILFTGTKADGHKAFPGQSASDLTPVTIAWPLVTPEDLAWMTTQPDTKPMRRQLLTQRLIRLIEHGHTHAKGPVLLTVADLSLLLGLTPVEVSDLLQAARTQSGKPLLTKGYYFDQGLRPSHKDEIIALYEQGMDEADIARHAQHAQSSVGRYLRDYERVKELIGAQIPIAAIPRLLGLQPSVVDAYVALLQRHRPALFASDQLEA